MRDSRWRRLAPSLGTPRACTGQAYKCKASAQSSTTPYVFLVNVKGYQDLQAIHDEPSTPDSRQHSANTTKRPKSGLDERNVPRRILTSNRDFTQLLPKRKHRIEDVVRRLGRPDDFYQLHLRSTRTSVLNSVMGSKLLPRKAPALRRSRGSRHVTYTAASVWGRVQFKSSVSS